MPGHRGLFRAGQERACLLAGWHLAGMLPWMSSQNLIGRPTRARSRSVCRSLFGPEPRLLSRSGCSVVRQPQNGRRYGGFASRPPQATCNVQAIRSPSKPCEPGELNRGPHRDHLPIRPASGRPSRHSAGWQRHSLIQLPLSVYIRNLKLAKYFQKRYSSYLPVTRWRSLPGPDAPAPHTARAPGRAAPPEQEPCPCLLKGPDP